MHTANGKTVKMVDRRLADKFFTNWYRLQSPDHLEGWSRLKRQQGGEQSGLVTLTFDLESGVRVTCDVGYLCANFGLPRPLCSRLRPDVRDRQTSGVRQTDVRQKHHLMPRQLAGARA